MCQQPKRNARRPAPSPAPPIRKWLALVVGLLFTMMLLVAVCLSQAVAAQALLIVAELLGQAFYAAYWGRRGG